MGVIYRLNRWYDDLTNDQGLLRFLIFIIPMMICAGMIDFGNRPLMFGGILGLAVMTVVRVLPVFVPRK